MKRHLHIWAAYSACSLLLIGVMCWLTATVLELDDDRRQMRRAAEFEEKVRLAMWRMDSLVAPLVGAENSRPYFAYTPFHPSERAYTRMFARLQPGEVLFPSPILSTIPEHILVHFQVEPSGEYSSPQVPVGNMLDLAESGYLTHDTVQARDRLLAEVEERTSREWFLERLPPEDSPVATALPTRVPGASLAVNRAQLDNQPALGLLSRQSMLNSNEWEARNVAYQQATVSGNTDADNKDPGNIVRGVMRPIWAGDALLLARRVTVGAETYVQGCWLDWPSLGQLLLSGLGDLLPAARLEAVDPASAAGDSRILASLPVRLLPGDPAVDPNGRLSPIRISLIIGWACMLLAVLAVGVVLRSAVMLSERRGAFVSAVTHELRTPLTTFRMYAEMLEAGMVPAEEQGHYLKTLRLEADRLGHLVENVLAYARLERNRSGGAVEIVSARELMDQVADRLRGRAEQAGMKLNTEMGPEAGDLRVEVDRSAIERILFNLVDNAGKYAAGEEDSVVRLCADKAGSHLLLKVWDNGPGVQPKDRRRLFKPFMKSARDAAYSAPGIGLGLSLSKRLASRMGGDLTLDADAEKGACFVLKLPVTPHLT